MDEAPEAPQTAQRAATSQPKRGGAVMVVEDEDALRKLVSSMMSAAGYQVTVAWGLVVGAAKRIDLLLTETS